MKSIEHKRGKDQVFTSSMNSEATRKWNALDKSPEGLLLPKLASKTHPMVKKQVVKITYPPFYLQNVLSFQRYIVIYFVLKSKLFWQKWVFIFTFLQFWKMTFDSVFEFFQVNKGSCLRFGLFWSFLILEKNKKVLNIIYTFYMLIKNPVERCRVYFFTFSDSKKMDYEKGTWSVSYI